MTNDDEEKLRRGFEKLRAEDARRAPRFEELVKRGPPRSARSPWAIVVPLGSVAAAAAVFLLWCGTQQMMSPPEPTAAAPPAGSAVAVDQPAAVTDTKPQAPPDVVAEREPLGFLLTLPASAATEPTGFLLQGWQR